MFGTREQELEADKEALEAELNTLSAIVRSLLADKAKYKVDDVVCYEVYNGYNIDYNTLKTSVIKSINLTELPICYKMHNGEDIREGLVQYKCDCKPLKKKRK